MSSVGYLREFVNERLTAAAEEIFRVFEKIIVQYEEELDCQRKLVDVVCQPTVKLHRIELPHQHVCQQEDLTDQQLCTQERSSSLDQEDPEPPQIKEEQEQFCISQEGEQLELKQETETTMLTPANEESDRCDRDSGSTSNAEQDPNNSQHKSTGHTNSVNNLLESHNIIHKCDTCGEAFKYKSHLLRHSRTHTSEEPCCCKTCGKRFCRMSTLKIHMKVHTHRRTYVCKTCGKMFRDNHDLKRHMRIHTGEKPFPCNTCGKDFRLRSHLTEHMRIHTGEKPYSCDTCQKSFCWGSELKAHIRVHTGEAYSCKTCGKHYRRSSSLSAHTRRAHIGEVPYICKICHKRYFDVSQLAKHMRVHVVK